MTEGELRTVRGRRVAMIYQDPMSSLNPLMTIGAQLMEVPMVHGGVGRNAAHELALGILGEVDLPDPEWLMARYPHQLSGRTTAARRHRDGAHLQACAPDHGRADDGA